jgi:hypothetical protein
VTTRGNLSSTLTLLLVKLTFLDPKGKVDNRLPYFKGMCFCNLNLFGTERSSKFLRFPCATRGHVLPFGRFCPSFGALLEFPKSFLSKAFPLIRKGLLVFDWHCFDILFWVFAPRFVITGQQCLRTSRIGGVNPTPMAYSSKL